MTLSRWLIAALASSPALSPSAGAQVSFELEMDQIPGGCRLVGQFEDLRGLEVVTRREPRS